MFSQTTQNTFFAHFLLAGCLLPNPDFAGPGAGGTSSSSGEGTLSSSTTVEPATSLEPTTTGSTTELTSEGTSAASTSGSTTSSAATDCWGPWASEWSVMELLDAELGLTPSSPQISADGLILYYMAGAPRRPYKAVRGSLAEPFTIGAPLIAWPGQALSMDYPNLRHSEGEVILAGRTDMDSDLYVAVKDGDTWSDPSPLGGPGINTPVEDSLPSLSADALRMIFERNDGPLDVFGFPSWRFYEATRAADVPGAAFKPPELVVLPTISDDPDAVHVSICPTLSPDGEHLFFGSTYPLALDEANKVDAVQVYATRRSSVDAPWEVPTLAGVPGEKGFETCPSAVTADGCTLVFHRFSIVPRQQDYRIFLATRAPG